jgi:hypothetical protein
MTSFTTDFTGARESTKDSEAIKRSVVTTRIQTEQAALELLFDAKTRRESERRRREVRAAWYDFHERMRETHIRLAEDHETKALSLLESGDLR